MTRTDGSACAAGPVTDKQSAFASSADSRTTRLARAAQQSMLIASAGVATAAICFCILSCWIPCWS